MFFDIVAGFNASPVYRPFDSREMSDNAHDGPIAICQRENDRSPRETCVDVRNVALGDLRLPTESVRRAFEAVRGGGRTADAPAGLTSREREILVSFAQGMSYARIAQARGIKPVTARNAIYAIQRKLGIGTRQGLVPGACETD